MATPALAQRITVQQPVVETFSVDTVVSVPDRGRMFFGGVGQSATSTSNYGLAPGGSSVGGFSSHSGMDVGVYIHDLDAMDEYLLSRPTRFNTRPTEPSTPASRAWSSLQSSATAASSSRNERSRTAVPSSSFRAAGPPQTDDNGELAAFYIGKARVAESQGKDAVARLCYRMAARYGSQAAQLKLPHAP
ncbi:MAG: hypothetical protein DWQ34_28380 [Planctomycetota bacterium]|nr:MAG: hypothetical protein DWQ34_28380 [Planctomycetota bacterium]REK32973.1 MAG: hypothetical protein DWQ45_15310 [Planctomycetota bacterium]